MKHVLQWLPIGIVPSTLNTTVRNKTDNEVLYIIWQVIWSNEEPEPVTISRPGEFFGGVV
jgi:hypothetical protein